jgi:hypothetical protein
VAGVSVIGIRAALFISGFMGVLWTLLGLFTPNLNDLGAGMVVAATSVIGWGLCDYLERNE